MCRVRGGCLGVVFGNVGYFEDCVGGDRKYHGGERKGGWRLPCDFHPFYPAHFVIPYCIQGMHVLVTDPLIVQVWVALPLDQYCSNFLLL